MIARALFSSFLVTLAMGCNASHPGDTSDAGPLDGAQRDAPSTGGDGGDVDAPGPTTDAGRDAGSGGHVCDGPSGCVLRPASCCGSCGAATPEDMIALSTSEVAGYVATVCMDVGCPECAREPDPYLLATCRAFECVAVNLHAEPLTECATTADCTLAPAECCACGLLGVSQVIAFNPANGSIGSLTCDPDADCPPCVPDFGTLAAVCNAGRCEVQAP